MLARNNSFISPPLNIINQLIGFAQIGDLLGLKHQLNDLIMSEPRYTGFMHRINTLANEFRIGDIKQILKEAKNNE